MATNIWGLKNSWAAGDRVASADLNKISNAVESVGVESAEYTLGGFLAATDFNYVSNAGFDVTVSGGHVVAGATGQRKWVVAAASQVVTFAGSGGGALNYVYVKQDGTLAVVQNPVNAPANSYIALTGVATNPSTIGTINNFPAGRVNLLEMLAVKVSASDRQGGYISGKFVAGAGITLTVNNSGANETVTIAAGGAAGDHTETLPSIYVTCPPGEDRIVKIDFSNRGSFANDYHVHAAVDQDVTKTLISELIGGKTGGICYLLVQNGTDAAAGTYATSSDVKLDVVLEGLAWTAGGSPSGAPTVTTSTPAFAGGSIRNPITARWIVDDVSAVNGNAYITGTAAATGLLGKAIAAAGKIHAITIFLAADVGGVGASVSAELYKNAVATGLIATVTGAGGTEIVGYVYDATGIAVAAGDYLLMHVTHGGSPGAGGAAIDISGLYD